MIDLCEFILKSFRETVPWKVYQGSKLLHRAIGKSETVFEDIKKTEIHIPSDEEIAKETELIEKRYRERMERLKEAKKKKAEVEKLKKEKEPKKKIKCKHEKCDRSVLTGYTECYVHFYARSKRKALLSKKEEALLTKEDIETIDQILEKVIKK